MGFAERRAAKEFQDKEFPRWKSEIEAAAGFAVPVTVIWDQLAVDGYDHLYAEAWPKVYFKPLSAALQSIASDQMGKDALKSALKTITICNVSSCSNADSHCTFQGGELKLDHSPVSNIDYEKDRTTAIVKLLEKAL